MDNAFWLAVKYLDKFSVSPDIDFCLTTCLLRSRHSRISPKSRTHGTGARKIIHRRNLPVDGLEFPYFDNNGLVTIKDGLTPVMSRTSIFVSVLSGALCFRVGACANDNTSSR